MVILTAPDAQEDFLACPVTSRAGWVHARPLSSGDLTEGGLPLDSGVRADKVVTLHMGLIVRRFGRVTAAFRSTIAAEVCRLLDAPPAVVTP